jgi:hypothetical protein
MMEVPSLSSRDTILQCLQVHIIPVKSGYNLPVMEVPSLSSRDTILQCLQVHITCQVGIQLANDGGSIIVAQIPAAHATKQQIK